MDGKMDGAAGRWLDSEIEDSIFGFRHTTLLRIGLDRKESVACYRCLGSLGYGNMKFASKFSEHMMNWV